MESSAKKRKAEENGAAPELPNESVLTPEDVRKIIEPFTQDQVLDILQNAALEHPDVLDSVRTIADRDTTQRKLFIRGLGWDTSTDNLRSIFSAYGELAEAVVIVDKVTGKSKGYGFITFKHVDGALLALKEPSKKIDGRMTVTQLASSGQSGPPIASFADASQRKIYVGNVPHDMPADRLLAHFSTYGEIEEGPLGFDKVTGKSRGFSLFVYKTPEAAREAIADPVKIIDGHQMVCKLAIDGKKGKLAPGGPDGVEGPGMAPPSLSSLSSQYGVPGSFSSYGGLGGYQGGIQPQSLGSHHALNSPLQSSAGGQGYPSIGGQAPSSLGGAGGGYGAGLGAPYGSSQYGGPGSGAYSGLSGMSGSSALYRVPPSSSAIPTGGYADSTASHYGLSSSLYSSHQHQSSASTVSKPLPSAGSYQSMPPYY